MKLQEVTLYENRSHRILKEGWHDLTEAQQKYQLRWERELFPLLEQYVKVAEAELTADQIQAIFKGAEANAMASGTNQTALGKAGSAAGKAGAAAMAGVKMTADLAKKVDAKINELGRMAQNAGPVKNADAKFEELKKKISAENSDSKIVQGIQKVSDWAKANPGKASLAVGILTTIAAFAGGPAGGAAAGLILRASKDLLQGEKLSTAVGKSVKTAAYGALAGLAIQGLTDNMIDNIATGSEAEADAMMDAFGKANFKAAVDGAVADAGFDAGVLDGAMNYSSSGNINAFTFNYDMTMTADQVAQYKALSDAAANAKVFSPEYYEAAGKLHGFLSTTQQANADLTALARTIANIPKDALTGDQIDAAIAVLDNADKAIETLSNAGGAVGAAAQGALQTVDDSNKEMHKIKPIDPKEKEQLELDLKGGGEAKAESVDMEAEFDRYLQEAGFADMIKGAAGKVAQGAKAVGGAVADKAAAAGKELGNKATYNKMMSAWKKAGEPTDTGSIINILQGLGMSPEQIQTVGQEQGVELKAKNIGDPESPAPKPGAEQPNNAQGKPADDSATSGAADDSAPADAKAATGQTKTVQKGEVVKAKNGKEYRWEGALYTDVASGQTVATQDIIDMGLPHPKIDPVRDAIKAAGPAVIKLVIDQINSKGVKAGTKDAQVAKQAGAQGTQELPAAQNQKPKAGIAKPGTVAAKPKAAMPKPTAPAPTTIQ